MFISAKIKRNTLKSLYIYIGVTIFIGLFGAIYEMNSNIALIAQSLKQVEGDVGEVKENQKELSNKVSTLENAPAKETLDNIKKIKIAAITAVATMIATGVAGAIITALAK